MVPFFSRRSITILLLAFIVGALLGLGYWAISPVDVKTKMGWPPVRFEGEPDLYESFVYVELMHPGADFGSLKSLQREGEYYAAKMATSSFLNFLSEAGLAHGYSHTPEELAEMVRVRYYYRSEAPSMEIRVRSSDENEASLLASIVPEVFQDYLTAQARSQHLAEYQNMVQERDTISAALIEARLNLADVAAQAGVDGLPFDPFDVDRLELDLAYVVANAEAWALERELDSLASYLVLYPVDGVEEPGALNRLYVGDSSEPELVPPDRIRGRNALAMGAVLGLAVAWVGLNYRGLIDRLRPLPATAVRREEEEDEEETEE